MKTPLTKMFAAIVSVAALNAFAAPENSKANPDVMVVADAIANVPVAFRPAPGKPVYYDFLARGQITLGNIVAGIKMPNPLWVERAAEAALANQGYLRSHEGGPSPSIGIRLLWGDANFWEPSRDMGELRDGADPRYDRGDNGHFSAVYPYLPTIGNRDRWMQFYLLGAHKKGALNFEETARFRDAMRDDVLYVFLAAFQPAPGSPAKREMIWTTSMTIDGRNRLRDALPVMLASAAPYFGRTTEKPLFIGDRDRRDTKVEVGDLKVVSDEVPSKGPTREAVISLRAMAMAAASMDRPN